MGCIFHGTSSLISDPSVHAFSSLSTSRWLFNQSRPRVNVGHRFGDIPIPVSDEFASAEIETKHSDAVLFRSTLCGSLLLCWSGLSLVMSWAAYTLRAFKETSNVFNLQEGSECISPANKSENCQYILYQLFSQEYRAWTTNHSHVHAKIWSGYTMKTFARIEMFKCCLRSLTGWIVRTKIRHWLSKCLNLVISSTEIAKAI